jgi:hypothetical protein
MEVRLSASHTGRALFLRNTFFLSPIQISVRGGVNPRGLMRPEGLGKLIKFSYFIGFAPVTFRLVSQCPNRYAIDGIRLYQTLHAECTNANWKCGRHGRGGGINDDVGEQ